MKSGLEFKKKNLPIAMVRVTPIIELKPAVVPNIEMPDVKAGSYKK